MKKFISVAISLLILLFSISPSAFAISMGEEHTFVFEDGTQVNYYLDNNGLPYVIRNGSKFYAAIPLEEFIITDENLLNELNAGLTGNQPDIISPMATGPTSYYNLMQNPREQESNHYNKYMNFANTTTIATQNLGIYASHSFLYYKASNVKPSIGNKSVKITVRFYSISTEEWTEMKIPVDNISKTQIPIEMYSTYNYTQFLVYSESAKVSFNLEIFTSPTILREWE